MRTRRAFASDYMGGYILRVITYPVKGKFGFTLASNGRMRA